MNAPGRLAALVLAGSRGGGDPLEAYAGVSHKALIRIGERTMIERVVGALAAIAEVDRIVIAIERPEVLSMLAGLRPPLCAKPVSTMPAAASPSASVAAALERESVPLLATTADHALLQPGWLRQFIDACPPEVDLSLALARKEAIRAAAPDTQRTYLRFADGEFSGCNLFLLRRPAAAGIVRLWREIEAERKSPFRMMRRLGPGYALRYRFGRLRVAEALERLHQLSGASIGIVELADGRAAIDVDKPADLDLVRRLAAAEHVREG
ncbi:MAG TPA: NTP transferase domain-containing protein [Burkholderiales bacterium]|nr:NTP transferase domain-containing protein [Burkholderiales bacterium]